MAQRRSNFRVRPLDPYKALPVYRDVGDFDAVIEEDEPEEDVSKAGEQLKAESEKDKKKKKAAPAASVPGTLTEQLKVDEGTTKDKQFNLPVPETQKSSTFDQVVQGTFRVENAYIRHRITYNDDYTFSGDIEYELTSEDEEWLKKHSKYGPKGKFPLAPELLERIIDLMERKTGRDFPMSQSDAVKLCQTHLQANIAKENKVFEDVYNYWIQRRTKLKKPLLRRFWPITSPNDSSPNLTFRPREKERYRLRKKRQNDLDSLEKMVALRGDFEMMRMLLELVRRRENLHEVRAKLLEDEFEQALWDLGPGSSSSKEARESIAPATLPMGALSRAEVDAVFEIARSPQQSKLLSPLIQTISDLPGLEGSIADSGEIVERKPKKQKKNKKKRDGELQPGADLRPSSAAEVPDTVSSDAVDSTVPPVPAAKQQPPPPVVVKPLRPPQFLMDPTGPQYLGVDSEIYHPIVPTWPPSQPSLLDYRRRQTNNNQQALAFNKGFGSPRRPPVAKQERPRYRCRPRIGRGGRFIVDRVPVSNAPPRFRPVKEVYVGPDRFSDGKDFLDPCTSREEVSLDLIPACAPPPNLGSSQLSKIQSIYLQDDSDDEDVTVLEYPYLPASQLTPEEEAWLEASASSFPRTHIKTKETKFRFVV